MSKPVPFHKFCMAQVGWWIVDQLAGQRRGQSAFNRLADCRPDLAEKIRGGPHDPFHDDSRLDAFWSWLAGHWSLDLVGNWNLKSIQRLELSSGRTRFFLVFVSKETGAEASRTIVLTPDDMNPWWDESRNPRRAQP